MAPRKTKTNAASPTGGALMKRGGNVSPYRVGVVGSTPISAQWFREEFGVDADLLGRMTPEDVRAIALQSQEMAEQLRYAKIAAKHIEEMTKAKVQIEELRKEVLTSGMARKAEIDKLVSTLEVEVAKHGEHIKKMMQDTQQGVDLVRERSRSNLAVSRSKFQNELLAIRAKHVADMKQQTEQHKQNVQGISEAAQQASLRASQQRQADDYLNGRSNQPVKQGAWGGWFR